MSPRTRSTSKDDFSIGLIGLGGVAAAHLDAYEGLEHVSIRSVCDIDEARAATVGKRLGAKSFADARALLEAGGVDLALVLTPAATHRSIVESAASAGVHVFCEKPLAISIEDGEAMISACRNASVKFFYGASYRFLPAVITARELISEGEIGDVLLIKEELIGGAGLDQYSQLSNAHYPHGGPGGAGMGLVDHGIHLIDIFPWLIGSQITRIWGRGQISGAPPTTEFVAMTFENGAHGHLLYNAATYSDALPAGGLFSGGKGWAIDGSISERGVWDDDPGSISVFGSKGAIRVYHYANKLFLRNELGIRELSVSGRPPFGHFATQLEQCIRSIRLDDDNYIHASVGLSALKQLMKIYA